MQESGFRADGEVKNYNTVPHVVCRVSLSRAEANEAVSAEFEAIQDPHARGASVVVTRFGPFSTKSESALAGINPRTGESAAGRANLQGRQDPSPYGGLAFGVYDPVV